MNPKIIWLLIGVMIGAYILPMAMGFFQGRNAKNGS